MLSIIPFDVLYNAVSGSGDNSKNFKVFDLLKLFRLLRFGRIITYLKFKQNIKVGFRILYLFVGLLLLVHWVACLWYMIIDDSDWIPPKDVNYGKTDFYDLNMGG